jgi:hypothetical protein
MAAFGITTVEWKQNRGLVSIWRVSMKNAEESFDVEVPVLGSTDTTVLRKAVEKFTNEGRTVSYA